MVFGCFGVLCEGGGIWCGFFIKVGSGSEVKVVVSGWVVFVEWMWGFGNFLIVDYGNVYLMIYGNNDLLFK